MKLFKMKNNRNRILLVLCLTLSFIQNNYAQDREQKTNVIIDSLQTVESMKSAYIEFGLKPLKFEATKEDSIKLIELENKLTDNEIRRRLIQGFNDAFTDNEINDLYSFIKTTAFFKLLHSSITNKSISNQFKDIKTELDKITANIDNANKINRKPISKFEPIPIEREDGFYETVDYNPNSEKKDVQLEKKPSITNEDILEPEEFIPELLLDFRRKALPIANVFISLMPDNNLIKQEAQERFNMALDILIKKLNLPADEKLDAYVQLVD